MADPLWVYEAVEKEPQGSDSQIGALAAGCSCPAWGQFPGQDKAS